MTRVFSATLLVLLLAAPGAAQKAGELGEGNITKRPLGGAAKPGIRPTPTDTSTVPAEKIEPRLDMDAVKEPPPSAWDLRQKEIEAGGAPTEEEGRQDGISWGEQLAKTVVALLIVVGIIYLLFRVGLAKFVGMAAIKGGKSMKVVERVQLDARHALLIVELDGERRFLLGTGEQGIQMLARLDRDEPISTETQASFQEAMQAASVASERGDGEGFNA